MQLSHDVHIHQQALLLHVSPDCHTRGSHFAARRAALRQHPWAPLAGGALAWPGRLRACLQCGCSSRPVRHSQLVGWQRSQLQLAQLLALLALALALAARQASRVRLGAGWRQGAGWRGRQ